jgi:hypothetical protein
MTMPRRRSMESMRPRAGFVGSISRAGAVSGSRGAESSWGKAVAIKLSSQESVVSGRWSVLIGRGQWSVVVVSGRGQWLSMVSVVSSPKLIATADN